MLSSTGYRDFQATKLSPGLPIGEKRRAGYVGGRGKDTNMMVQYSQYSHSLKSLKDASK